MIFCVFFRATAKFPLALERDQTHQQIPSQGHSLRDRIGRPSWPRGPRPLPSFSWVAWWWLYGWVVVTPTMRRANNEKTIRNRNARVAAYWVMGQIVTAERLNYRHDHCPLHSTCLDTFVPSASAFFGPPPIARRPWSRSLIGQKDSCALTCIGCSAIDRWTY